jgi:Fur family transcriptional regulator, ferric uptake regulator
VSTGPTTGSSGPRRDSAWVEHVLVALGDAGYHRGGARLAVIEVLARANCAMSAIDIEERLRASGERIGRASVYRVLDQLEELKLVTRLEIDRGMASYERIEPGGEHHHHAVCEKCGRVEPFADPGLERAIGKLQTKAGFRVYGHEVMLRGRCRRCA